MEESRAAGEHRLKESRRQFEKLRARKQTNIQRLIDAKGAVLSKAEDTINDSRQRALDEIHERSRTGNAR